jgi:SAM-dependent MidA family methyltransferase
VRVIGLEGRRIVDQRVKSAEVIHYGARQLAARPFVRQVGGKGVRFDTEIAGLADRFCRVGSGTAVVHGDAQSTGRELEGDRPPHSARSTGYQTNSASTHASYNPAMPVHRDASVSTPLEQLIREAIRDGGGWLAFDRFMALALYAPGLGYYASPGRLFGLMPESGSDFVTGPELCPLFGHALARQVHQGLEVSGSDEVWEFGAGSGALAGQLLTALGDDVLARYHVIEVSGGLRARQAEHLRAHASRVHWHERLPDSMRGVVIGNELLDAMPVQLLHFDGQCWHERGVSDRDDSFVWEDRATTRRAPFEIGPWPGTTTEIHPQAEAFVATIAQRLERGAAFFIDYGFPRSEYYHPQRLHGTLMCHRAHRSDDNPLQDVGLKDITAHVDFTGIALAGQDNGLDVLGYTSQAHFLINCGLLEALEAARLQVRVNAQKLLTEHEMGELFKVIGFAKGCEFDALGFINGDRSHTL